MKIDFNPSVPIFRIMFFGLFKTHFDKRGRKEAWGNKVISHWISRKPYLLHTVKYSSCQKGSGNTPPEKSSMPFFESEHCLS